MNFRRIALPLALLASLSLVSCANMPKSADSEFQPVSDPLEPMNRTIFDVNDFLDRLLIRPLTELYRFAMPDYIRQRIANIVSNMKEPVIMGNNLLQGEFTKAGVTGRRFLVNTIVGVGGTFEVANGWGLPQQAGDFGQTLSTWGVGSGPYLVLPLFGPSNFRDAAGLGVDTVAEPWQWVAASGGRIVKSQLIYSEFAADGLTRREQTLDDYDALRAGSIDFYAEMRSVYTQYRDKQLGIKNPNASPNFDDYQ